MDFTQIGLFAAGGAFGALLGHPLIKTFKLDKDGIFNSFNSLDDLARHYRMESWTIDAKPIFSIANAVIDEIPLLRVVSDELWNAAKDRQRVTRRTITRAGNRLRERVPVARRARLRPARECHAALAPQQPPTNPKALAAARRPNSWKSLRETWMVSSSSGNWGNFVKHGVASVVRNAAGCAMTGTRAAAPMAFTNRHMRAGSCSQLTPTAAAPASAITFFGHVTRAVCFSAAKPK